ncbi:hypothetical protein LHV13_02870 [Ferrovum sp. PN-J185]|uniref:hypothetical protein n=1 Tax=Ferrovum sp. PN-J185 TaxID=1356306 RepID=UPI0007989376|nr:hypothetical protein [Ferrovum sp. PN-J185]KXW56533.1 hypothetical protein FV185_04850 [Ferrovum sp. PN-J185]MCC6068119.1 hypothetical protein [Ferrovum sp. PN-J185]MDE1891770.1 hypothetical protein [Betaproteobacteria bacterium]MDE2056384.1 hypothetical protein [Betaproteobacteria bacterium]
MHTIYKFECFKSFNVTDIYKNDQDDEIVITNLWTYATLEYNEDELPEKEDNGNYYDIFLPEAFDCSDLFVSNVDYFIEDNKLLNKISALEDQDKFIDLIQANGFEHFETQYDILDSGEGSIVVVEV